MKIALVAMSGVRAHDPELDAVGLTLPGFVERREVIASLPSLSLLTLAALTPADVELEYHEVRELEDAEALPALVSRCDLIALSTFSAQALEAYALADRLRAAGATVVLGGLHVSSLPEEAARHADAVVVGEGEPLWPRVVEDFRRGRLQRLYSAPPGHWHDLDDTPIPRYDLLDVTRYNRITVQTARGCPHRCEFCASSILLTPKYRLKSPGRVLAEIDRIREIWPRPFVEFADDNSFVRRAHARELLRGLRARDVRWFTETDLSIADDPDLLDLMREAGCRQVLVGLEAPTADGLDGLELRRNWKLGQQPRALEAVRRIQEHGITVDGCFILGLDGQDESVFDAVDRFVDESGLFEVQVTVLTPFPGTPLHARLEREGRLLYPGDWSRCTLFDVAFEPADMSAAALRAGLVDLSRRLYTESRVRDRRRRFFEDLRRARGGRLAGVADELAS